MHNILPRFTHTILRVHFTEYGFGRLFSTGKIQICAPSGAPASRIAMPNLKSHEYVKDHGMPGMAFLLYNIIDKLDFSTGTGGEIVVSYGTGIATGQPNRPLMIDLSKVIPSARP